MDTENKDAKFSSLVDFTVELLSFLKNRGYGVSDDFPQRFFTLIEAVGLDTQMEYRQYEGLYETLATTSKAEHERFHEDYAVFMKTPYSIVVSNKKADELRKACNASAAAQAEALRNKQVAERIGKKIEEASESMGTAKPLPQVSSKKKREKLSEDIDKLSGEMESAFSFSPRMEYFKDMAKMASREIPIPEERVLDQMLSDMKQGMKKAMKGSNPMEMLSLIDEMAEMVKAFKSQKRKENAPVDSIRDLQQQQAQALRAAQAAENRFKQLVDALNQNAMDEILKGNQPTRHRKEFDYPRNAVKSTYEGDISLDGSFQSLSSDQREAIRQYIRENARKFKTRMTRNIRSGKKVKLDLASTCKKACSTMGVPISLVYEKPKRNKAKLLMFLDVSGSCKEASEMMLVFMHAMKEVFPGGCRTYAFVNSLYDVSAVFESVDSAEAAQAVLSKIPRRGVYSDYNRPFSDYVQNHMNEISKDTLVFFIGDARNNRNPTSEENIKAIARKAKRAYWINTEDVSEWDRADSIMSVYSKYMNKVCQATTPGELIGFLTQIK